MKKTLDKKKDKIIYLGLELDSFEELYFCYWVEEMMALGFVSKVERGESYLLSSTVHNSYAKQLKTKSRPETQVIMEGHSYTPDFVVYWTKEGVEKFTWCYNDGLDVKCDKLFKAREQHWMEGPEQIPTKGFVSHIEIKPKYDFLNMTRAFRINQKWMYQVFKIFVNLIHPQDLFEDTFCPQKYTETSRGKKRKMKFTCKSSEEFLNGIKQESK